ncbi:hypothetical protein [Streptomyces sp. GC420]|uniref:hypothetical protein n=1 Tax=Streptomyces sp. GC420 TaxID=2697568 RepID=UPI00141524B4|nr:hypothetical protein [Streptomyces sp. GC420]NBM18589.1 hypothetical protein [Streptomyces sp. GC420]
MWPGQQPPGGEQNPQQPNPYQQPGYQQPNPYQQPGFQQGGYAQPNPYQQPTTQWDGQQPGMPGAPQSPKSGGRKTAAVAIVAATAVVITAVVTGVVVLGKDDEKTDGAKDGGKPAASASTSASPSEEASADPGENPRGSTDEKPQISGWKTVVNPKYGTAFDVPPEWSVDDPGVITGIEDEKADDGSPLVGMSAPAFYKKTWCTDDSDKDGYEESSSLASTGTKGGQGSKSTKEAAEIAANNWAFAAYAQNQRKGLIKNLTGEPYTSKSGLEGYSGKSVVEGIQKKRKCDYNGQAWSFAFKNKDGDFAIWVLHSAMGVKEAISEETAKKIMSTVRLTGADPAS